MFLAKTLIRAKQAKNEQLVNNINDELINLRDAIIKKEIPENENIDKIVDIDDKSLSLINNREVKESKYSLLNKCFKDSL